MLVALLLVATFVYLRRTTAGLGFPYDVDLYRDIGQAESVRDGDVFGDAAYRDELAWYNPLLSWLLAAASQLTGVSVATIATQGGVLLNLLGPVALVIVVRRWFGRMAAGFALVAYIFLLCGKYPSWAVATYSPWLFQANFGQGLFFIALLALPAAIDSDRASRAAVFGALMGVVALAHTAPALLLLVVLVAAAGWTGWRRRRPIAAVGRGVLISVLTAAVVAAPFLVPIAWKYHFQLRNELPSSWIWDELQVSRLRNFVGDFVLRWPIGLGAVGVICWWLRFRPQQRNLPVVILTAWTTTAFLGLAAGIYASTSLPLASRIPTVVPSYHFLLYLSAALCVWFGIGAAALARLVAELADVRPHAPVVAATGCVVMMAIALPTWRARDDLRATRDHALAVRALVDDFAVSRWISTATSQDDVVLYDIDPSLALVVNPLDRRPTVVVDPFFSNPYVAWQPRQDDSTAMLTALRDCDHFAFDAIAGRVGVTYVVTSAAGPLVESISSCPFVHMAYRDSFAAVLHVAPASPEDAPSRTGDRPG